MDRPVAVVAAEAAPRTKPSNDPELFASRMAGRAKHPLGDLFGLASFGVNPTRLPPGAVSALHRRHSRQDEFIFVLEGAPTPMADVGETVPKPGMCAGFPAGGTAHHLENRTDRDAVILEVGDRARGDEVSYLADDLQAVMGKGGMWRFTCKTARLTEFRGRSAPAGPEPPRRGIHQIVRTP